MRLFSVLGKMDILLMCLVYVVMVLCVMLPTIFYLLRRNCGRSALCLVGLALVAAMLIGFVLGIAMELNR